MAIPSLMQKSFADTYDEFLFACSHGDYLSVERLLRENHIHQDDICRTVGNSKLSPMVIAIEHQHLEVIKILLDHLPYTDFREALLLAIYLDLTKIAQLIMEHETFRCFHDTFADWQTDTVNTFDESHFAVIQPIQLAAQYNRTTVLYHFLQRECEYAGLNDSLRYSQLRLSTYRALASDVYLTLVSEDPITSAFDLCSQLSDLVKNEPNLADEYQTLFNQVSQLSARLLDHIQSRIELKSLLTIERLKSAIKHNQQEFLTHPNTQLRLSDLWCENIGLSRLNTVEKRILASIQYSFIYLPMYIGYFWLPFFFEKYCRWYFHQPAIQTLIHGLTYQIFLIFLLISSILQSSRISLKTEYPQIFEYYQRVLPIDAEDVYYQKSILSYWKILILIWMIGYIYRNVNTILRKRGSLGIMDKLMTILFILFIILFTIAVIQVHLQWLIVIDIEHWEEFERLHNESQFSVEYFELKHRLISNLSKQSVDIPMIADGVFTLTIVCCIIHLCIFVLLSELFGPLLVSLIIMSRTIYRWFILILIFIFAYQASLLNLFAYYQSETTTEPNSTLDFSRPAAISRSFGTLKRATINVFFSVFGIPKNELTQTFRNLSDPNYFLNTFTSTTGSLIYGSFALFIRIIFITMIIAYIKRIYNLNKEQVLNNWHFARAKLYMRFIAQDPDVLPVPLNLIPTFRHIRKLFQRKSSMKPLVRKRHSKKPFLRNFNDPVDRYQISKKPTAEEVMNLIVSRFLRQHHPQDLHSLQRARQSQYKEELSVIRHYVLEEIETLQLANQRLKEQISTVFFGIDHQHQRQ